MKILLALLFTLNCYGFDHSHGGLALILKNHIKIVDKQSLINYQAIKKNPQGLETYLKKVSAVSKNEYEKWSSNKKLAFLINAYNAFTIKLIISNYPVKSIKDIGSFFSGPWDKKFFTLLGKKRNLDWIEHKKIRVDFKEPRIHFALVCASISCPNLKATPYTENELDLLLEGSTHFFLNDTKKNYIRKDTLYVSKIFKWYEGDFKNVKEFVLNRLNTKSEARDINYIDYNWDLNEWK